MDAFSNIVTEWLRSLDLVKYADAFLDNGYDDLETCKQIGPEDLTAIGVLDPCDRGELLTAVGRLKLEGGTAVYFTLQPTGRRIEDLPPLPTNGHEWPTGNGYFHENGNIVGFDGLPPTGYRRGISVDTSWPHINRTGKSLSASPVRHTGVPYHHRRSSEGKLPAGGDRTPDLLKKVSAALSSSSSSFESVDAQTASSTPFLLMAQQSDNEEPGNLNNGANGADGNGGEGGRSHPAMGRKKSTSQKAATALKGLFKSKQNEKSPGRGVGPPEIEKAADLNLTSEELMEIQFAVSNKSMTIDEAIMQAKEKGLKNHDKKRKLSLIIHGRKSTGPLGGRHKNSSSEEHLLPGPSASETSSVQDEGAMTPPDEDQDTLQQRPDYSRQIYKDIPGGGRTVENRISVGSRSSASSAEVDTGLRRFSEDACAEVKLTQEEINTLESNASTASFHSTSSWDSTGANSSGGVQLVDGPPENYIAIGLAITDYTTSPYRGHLTLKQGDLVYITSANDERTSGEGVCNNTKGVFKYRHIKVLTEEELMKMERGRNLKSPEAVLKLTSVKELLERINCSDYYPTFKMLGVDTLGHFKHLSEESLDMLGVRDDKHRLKLLTARDIIKDPDRVQSLDPELEQEFFSDTHSDPDDSGVAEDMSRLQVSPRDSGYMDGVGGDRDMRGGDRDMRGGDRESRLAVGADVSVREERDSGKLLHEWGMAQVFEEGHDSQNNLNNSNNANLIGRLDWCEDGHLLRMRLPGASTHRPLGGVPYSNQEGHKSPATLRVAAQTLHQSTPTKPGSTELSGDISGVDLLKNHPLKNDRRHSMHRYERPWAADSTNDHWGTVPRHRPPPGNQAVSQARQRRITPPTVNFSDENDYFRSSSLEEPLFQMQTHNGSHIHHPKTMNLGRKGRSNMRRLRKSRSVSPHKRAQQGRHGVAPVAMVASQHHPLLHSSQSLGPPRGSSGLTMTTTRERLIERKLEKKLRQDGIDLRDEPYSDKMGFCGIPPALVQRYADEIQAKITEVADVLEDIRIQSLLESGKLSFKSDQLSRQAEQLVLEGRGTSISDWLISLGLPMYTQPFFAKGWDELHILVNMEVDDLQTCGVHDQKHLRRLQTALEKLRLNYTHIH